MERSNQPTKPECCRREGQAPTAKEGGGAERPVGGVPREIREPQAGVAPRLSNSASKPSDAGGQDVLSSEPKIREAVKGEALRSLPGSKSVAREEGTVRNQGDPVFSRRTNYEGQVGREVQRQGGPTERTPGVGSLHSSSRQGASPERYEHSVKGLYENSINNYMPTFREKSEVDNTRVKSRDYGDLGLKSRWNFRCNASATMPAPCHWPMRSPSVLSARDDGVRFRWRLVLARAREPALPWTG